MKKEVIIVPKEKCPLDVLAEMGERTKNSWIFFHENAIQKLEKTATYIDEAENNSMELFWSATEKYPATDIYVETSGIWHRTYRIIAEDISFETEVPDPEDIFFLKMDE